ncbi:MAG: hypothetical protein QXK80_03505 [Candidatus Pacearchaeota archaeon]
MKLLKKIAPLAVALLFAGTTVAAADLANWRASFPGADTAIVVGASSAAEDTLGAIDIAAALGITSGGEVSTPAAAKLEASGTKLNIGDSLNQPITTLTDEHLPNLLAGGTFRNKKGTDFKYTQQIALAGNAIVDYERYDDVSEKPGLYIFNEEDDDLLTYSLIFTKGASSTVNSDLKLADFEDRDIKIMGKNYALVEGVGSGAAMTLTLLGGQVKMSLFEDQEAQTATLGGKQYKVKVFMIDSENRVKLEINDEKTDVLEEGDTYKLSDGTIIGIREIMRQEFGGGKRMVTFYLGAEKIEIYDDDVTDGAISDYEIKVNDEDVEGVFGGIHMTEKTNAGTADEFDSGDSWELNRIEFLYTPNDDVYIYKDHSFKDPALGSFEIQLKGLETKNVQDITIKTSSSDKLIVTVPIKQGNVDINAFYYDSGSSSFELGKDASRPLVLDEGTDDGSSDFEEDYYFIVTRADAKDESYYMYVKDLKNFAAGGGTVTLRDVYSGQDYVLTYGSSDEERTFTIGSTTVSVNLVTAGTPEDGIDAIDLNADGNYGDTDIRVNTKYGGQVFFDLANEQVVLYEEEDEDGNSNEIYAGFIWDGTDNRIELTEPTDNLGYIDLQEIEDTDKYEDYSVWGTKVWYDSSGQGKVVLSYPDEQAIVSAYVTETGVTLGEAGGGGVPGSFLAVLDTELSDVKNMNVIVIGGSGINRAAAELLGVSYPTYGSQEAWQKATNVDGPGKAIIKLMDSPWATGKMAMLVAGWEGVDTRRATKALREDTLKLQLVGKTSALLNTASTVSLIEA